MAISKFPRKLPLMAGIFVTVLSVAAMTSPSTEQFLSPGGDNEMHEGMKLLKERYANKFKPMSIIGWDHASTVLIS